MSFETASTIASFGGKLLKLTHESTTIKGKMALNLYIPPGASESSKVPIIFYLAGLTCTGDNGAEKGFFQNALSKKGIAMVYPDTSPRGTDYVGQDESYDFGSGAGFYIDATEKPWAETYKMYTYIAEELYKSLPSAFPVLDGSRISITGHSMGGHGALTLFLKNPTKYKSVSAFAPITNPINCPWGKKAFKGYFGEANKDLWANHDATELLKQYKSKFEALIDVGTGDNFYKQKQLLPENLAEAAKESGNGESVEIRYQPDYDHSYYFISTFAESHVEYHAKYLLDPVQQN